MNNDLLQKLMQGINTSEEKTSMIPSPLLDEIPAPIVEQPKNSIIQKPLNKSILPENKIEEIKPKEESKKIEEISNTLAVKEPSMLEKLLSSPEDTTLNQALDRQQNVMDNVSLMRGAQAIGAALGRVKPDENYMQSEIDAAKSKVSGIKQLKDDKKDTFKFAMDTEKGMMDLEKARTQMDDFKSMQDPNSEISKAWRETARTRFKLAGVEIPKNLISDTLPASKVKELFPSGDIVDDLIKLKGMEESAALRKEAKSDKNQQQAQQQVDRYIQHTQDKFKDDISKVKEGRNAVTALESAIRNPSSVKDLQAVYNMIKAFDPNSAVREGELVMAQKGQSFVDNAKTLFSKAGNNPRILTGRYLKDIYEYSKAAQAAREQDYRKTMDTRLEYAKTRLGLPEGQEIFIDPLYEDMKKNKTSPTTPSSLDPNAAKAELERRMKGK